MSTQIRSDFFLRRCGIIGTVLLCFSVVLLAGCDSASTNEPARTVARPVAYMTLSESDPSRHALVAGSVESWKKELVGFQVDGRVNFVRDPGVGVQGRVIDDDAKVTNGGTLVASLDNERYRLRVEEAKARVDSARAEAQAVMTDIEKTIPNELREVQAEHERARKELRRQQRLLRQGAGTQARVDNVRAEFKAASARLARTRSKQEERRAQYASAEAQIVQAREGLRQAQADLSDTELYSPFNGQVSRVHVIPGGYVEQGQPVVTVQMMDPMKVQVAVSPATDREVHFNDLMKVFVAGSDKPLNGWVWNKDTVADASTRTFMVTLLVRNRQVEVGLSEELRGKPFHRTDGLWNLESELDNAAAPYFTNVDTLRTDENGHFVWRVRGLSVSDLERDFEPVFTVEKVRITVGERKFRYLDIITYQEVIDLGALDPSRDLLAGKLPDGVEEGDTVFLSRKQWLLRPGQLVNVDLHHGRVPAGFYVPADAIVKDNVGHHVYVVNQQDNGEERADRVDVELGATVGTFQGVQPVSDGVLTEGTRLIVDGAHYLRDGETVNAFNEIQVAL